MVSIKMQNVKKVFMALAKNIKFGTFKKYLYIIYILNGYKMQILPFWVLYQIQKPIVTSSLSPWTKIIFAAVTVSSFPVLYLLPKP